MVDIKEESHNDDTGSDVESEGSPKKKKNAVVPVRNKQSQSLESVESERTNESTGTSIKKCFTKKSKIAQYFSLILDILILY